MPLFVWVKPAGVKGSPVDHTWVTTYDSRQVMYNTVADVLNAKEHYWYCKGFFHLLGVSTSYSDGCILEVPIHAASFCLVGPNIRAEAGTIHVYGLDGVCHQVSNQILYPTGRNVRAARGYKLSTAIFGTFGRQWDEWQAQIVNCQANAIQTQRRVPDKSLLLRRAQYAFGTDSPIPMQLDVLRNIMLDDIDTIGYAVRGQNETIEERVTKLNYRISTFLNEVANIVQNDAFYYSAFGLHKNEEVNIIDPELFDFPSQNRRSNR